MVHLVTTMKYRKLSLVSPYIKSERGRTVLQGNVSEPFSELYSIQYTFDVTERFIENLIWQVFNHARINGRLLFVHTMRPAYVVTRSQSPDAVEGNSRSFQ